MPKNINEKLAGSNEIMLAENNLRDKIYTIRGQKVMLDYDLAEIYGYTTSAFNQQVKRNIDKFEEDFMFQLTRGEVEFLYHRQPVSISQNVISIQTKGMKGGRSKPIYAFTESGIYMLMTVLKGKLATRQSRTLIRTFRNMKDYILETKNTLAERDNLSLVAKMVDNTKDIVKVQNKIKEIDNKVNKLTNDMVNVVRKSDIPPVFLDFNKTAETREYLILNGEPIKAKDAYMEIYKHAKHRIYIVDNYISIKTLHLLQIVKQNLEIVFFTDNANHYLRKSDLIDFQTERPDLKLTFIKTNQTIHDRFIILDDTKVYLTGGSSKDAGKRMSMILEIDNPDIKKALQNTIEKLKQNPRLGLR